MHLAVHLYAGLAPELSAGQVGVVGGVDVVFTQRLVHVLVDIHPAMEGREVVFLSD